MQMPLQEESLSLISTESRWNQNPASLRQTPDSWPEMPPLAHTNEGSELKKSIFCGLLTSALSMPDLQQFPTFTEYLKTLIQP